jgi:hypothetical protein
MNKVLRGSLIQRPKSIPHPTLMPRKERMWHAEHFGNVSETKGKIAAAKMTGEAVSEAASSEEAKVAGEVAKDTGKELLRILFETVKILLSSSSGIAIYSGILWIVSKNMSSKEELTEILKKSFIISLIVGIMGAFATFLMSYKEPTKAPEDENTNDAEAEAEAEAAVQLAMAEDTVEDDAS